MLCGRPTKWSGTCRLRERGRIAPSTRTVPSPRSKRMSTLDMSTSAKPLHIDIPVKLAEVKVAFSVPALAFEGDLPASIFHLQLIEKDIADWNANAQVIAVFHTNAGHVRLNDKAYNTERNVATGNPYKDLVSDLMK